MLLTRPAFWYLPDPSYPVFGRFWTHIGPKFSWRSFLGLEGHHGVEFDPPKHPDARGSRLAADRRKKAKTNPKPGQGYQGDR